MFFSIDDVLKLDIAWRTKAAHNGHGFPGYIENALTGIEQTLSPLGLGFMDMPDDAGETLSVVSTSVADVGQLILTDVLDSDGLEKTAWAITNGLTKSELRLFDPAQENPLTATPILISRVQSVANRSQSRLMTAGDVLVVNSADVVYDGFKQNDGRSLSLKFTIPSDSVGYFLPSDATLNKTGSSTGAILRTRSRVRGGMWLGNGPWGLNRDGTSAYNFVSADAPRLPPFTDLMVTCEPFANGAFVCGRVSVAIIKLADAR